MENRRFLLLALIGVVFFFMYQAWQKDYAAGTPAPVEAPRAAVPEPAPADADVPVASAAGTPAPAAATAAEAAPAGERIRVETDALIAEIALDGGDLRRLELKGYPRSKDRPDQPMALLDDRDGRLFVLQSGLAGPQAPLVTHQTRFRSAQPSYALAPDADAVEVVLEHADPAGFTVRKIYRFKRLSYQIDLVHELANTGGTELAASAYARFVRTEYKSGDEPPFVATFTGVGFYEQKPGTESYRFLKTALSDLGEDAFETRQQGGWVAMLQHYFIAALLPAQDQPYTYAARPAKDRGYLAQVVGPTVTVAPGAQHTYTLPLYVGPKLHSIGAFAPGLELTLDYGILKVLAKPLFWLLEMFHDWVKNWGFAIILLTIVVKAAMYKLSEAQYRSMAKMKKFAPKIQDIKERYGEDRERMQKAMMELYKKEGFNPLAGCWPLLVQFPVFIALYWVLLESVEMRQAPFALWIQDLSAPDPYYVLPVLFGLSMFVQQKLAGQQMPDPMQQRIMNMMPIMLTAFFAFFQSGLVLYWLVSNLIGIAQQWYITRKLEREGVSVRAAKA